jgi:division protein CdvB (Snf7/Vps24/ESCRT-III family)
MNEDITNELKRLSRRIEEIGRVVDLVSADRDILEDVLTRLTAVENAMHLSRSVATDNVKQIKEDINGVKDIVEAKVDQVNENFNERTVVVKAAKMSVVQRILLLLQGKKYAGA